MIHRPVSSTAAHGHTGTFAIIASRFQTFPKDAFPDKSPQVPDSKSSWAISNLAPPVRMVGHPVMSISQRRSKSVFVELMPLLKTRLSTTPLSYTGSPEEQDRELGQHLGSHVDCHLVLGTLATAKAEMDAAAKAGRQKAKTTQQTSKPGTGTKKEESATPVSAPPDTTPSLFPA